jgi:hypothetical protein
LSFSLAMAAVVACRASPTASTFPPDDASSAADGDAPDGPISCGSSALTCGPEQYCVLGCTDEGPVFCSPLGDGGACPPGTALSNACEQDGAPCRNNATVFPTECVDAATEAPCPNPNVQGRTIACNCTI